MTCFRIFQKEEAGYFTIEAAFLVPLIFLLVFAVMLSGLYICDLNQAKSFLNQRVTELSLNGEKYEGEAQAEDKNQLKRQLFVTSLTDFYIKKTESKVQGEVSLSMRPNVPVIGDWIGKVWTDTFSLYKSL